MSDYKFKVDLKGIIRLLSDNLYSDDSVFLRELLQNAVDAIAARKLADPTFTDAGITVEYEEDEEKEEASLVFKDNGIGLTKEEVHEFLSIIGKSSKSGAAARDSFIGQFGIGLLSCFLVTDTIEVLTKSAGGGSAHIWYGKSDGTYEILEAHKEEPGTEVKLILRGGFYETYEEEEITARLGRYGYMLKTPILFRSSEGEYLLNDNFIPWHEPYHTKEQVLEFGEDLFERTFLEAIPLKGEGLDGYAFVSNQTTGSQAANTHKIYLKDMFITESGAELIPKWAFFTKCVVNTSDLTPTAAREGFQRNNKLIRAKAQIERSIIEYFKALAEYDTKRLTLITQIHNVAIKSLAVDNDKVFGMFFPFLTFPTSKGVMTGAQLLSAAKKRPVFYCENVDSFRKICPVMEQKTLLINGGYIYDSALLKRISKFHKNVAIKPLSDDAVGSMLTDIPCEEAEQFDCFIKKANASLKKFNCACEIKIFSPAELSALFVPNEEAFLMNDMGAEPEDEDGNFSFFDEEFEEEYWEINLSRLYLNFSNSLVRKFAGLTDEGKIQTAIEVLYVQALMMGHHPVNSGEMNLLSKNLTKLLDISME